MNKDKFVERVVGILSDRIEEGLVKDRNKAAKKSWEAEQGKKKFAAKVGVTPREQQAAQKGGKGGGVEAMKRGVQASYRATHREVASHDPRSEFIDRIVNNVSESFARHAAAVQAKGEKGKGARMAARDIIDSAKANNPKQPKKEEASNDPKVNFINRTVDTLMERLIGKQKKLDVNKSGKLDAEDFKMLRKGKRKDEAQDPTTRGAVMTRVARGKLTGNPASTAANVKDDADFYGTAMANKRKERLAQVAGRKDESDDYGSALDKKDKRIARDTNFGSGFKVNTPAAGAAGSNLAGAARRVGDKKTARLALQFAKTQPKPKLP